MPDLIPADPGILDRHPEVVEFPGFPLEFVPHSMRGGNDENECFLTFYEAVNIEKRTGKGIEE